MSGYACPYCSERSLESVASLPYVRGFLLAYQVGTKRFVGCRSCVRVQIYKEAGLSTLIGWFSITAFFLNPVFITYGLVRGLFVGKNPDAVRKQLHAAGIPAEPSTVDPLQVAYGLAASMIAADGKVEQEEVMAAVDIGQRLFDGFEPEVLMDKVKNHKSLPGVGVLSSLMSEVLTDDGKDAVYAYMQAIAAADGEVAPEEQAQLDVISQELWAGATRAKY